MTTSTANQTQGAMAEYSDTKRLGIYKMITSACTHLYSKGKFQKDKFIAMAPLFADIAVNDPLFMAQLTAWAGKKDSKDMKVMSVFFNALSDANGLPLFEGASKNKPNLRAVSYALLQEMEPALALRVLQLSHLRFGVPELLNEARHLPTALKKAFKKYIRYREQNPDMLRGIRRTGLGKKMADIYRMTHTSPSDDAAAILKWKQKDNPDIQMERLPDFEKKSSLAITKTLAETKVSPMVALSIIPPDKITASVARELLKGCTGNQSIILYRWFAKNGFLDVPDIRELFGEKIKSATTAVDRIDTLTRDADAEDKHQMAQARSERRKKDAATAGLGKIFLHIDASTSMTQAIDFAKDRAAIIAECVSNPKENFRWGLFGTHGISLDVPDEFTKEDFHAALYGVRASMGSTDCVALYPESRAFGADVDVYITDQGHNVGTINRRIRSYHEAHPEAKKPRAAVIVDFSSNRRARVRDQLETGLMRAEIPVSIMTPESLTESALVAQSVRAAVAGELVIIDEIMDTKLPSLPSWWQTI